MMKFRIHNFKWVLFLLVVFLAMIFFMRMTADEVQELSDGQGILDLTFAVSPEKITQALRCYTSEGVFFYRFIFLLVDFIYALIYCTFYRCAIGYFCDELRVSDKTEKLLTALPLIGMSGDIIENNILFIILAHSSGE